MHIDKKEISKLIDSSYEAWEKEWNSLTEEEEKVYFLRRQQRLGYKGDTYEGAVAFFNAKYPTNRRNEVLARRFGKVS